MKILRRVLDWVRWGARRITCLFLGHSWEISASRIHGRRCMWCGFQEPGFLK